MPLYDFKNTKTGKVREFLAPASVRKLQRQDGLWERIEVSRLGIVVAPHPGIGQREEVLAGYAATERKLGTRFRTRLPASKIKEIWNRPDPQPTHA